MKTKEAYQQGLRTYLILKNYSPATVSAYGCAFGQFLDWRIEGKYGADFTPRASATVFALSLRAGSEVADHQAKPTKTVQKYQEKPKLVGE